MTWPFRACILRLVVRARRLLVFAALLLLRRESVIRIGAIAAIVASCAKNAAVQPPPRSPIPSPPPCVDCAPPRPPAAKPEIHQGPPRVTSVHPTQGTTAGGEEISIFGEGFVPGKTLVEVRFGRKKFQRATVASTSRILVVTPPGENGYVDILIGFDDGQVFMIPNGFCYVEPTEGESIRPSSRP